MELIIQIRSLVFSFFYGVFFSFLLTNNYKFIHKGSLIYRITISILFVINNCLLYFIIIKKINNGIIHFYFVSMIVLGYFAVNPYIKKINFEKEK